MERVILFGNSTVASHVFARLVNSPEYEVAAFTVDREYIQEDSLFGLPVIPFEEIESQLTPDEYRMLVSMSYRGVNKLRAEKYQRAKSKGYQLVTVVSSRAMTWPDLVIGDNCRVGDGVVIDPLVKVGNDVVIASGCVIGHHTVIKDHCYIAAGAVISGNVTVDPYCFIGANATVRDRIRLAKECVVGAGAVVLENTHERGVYLGSPAELLPTTSDKLVSA